MSIPQGIRSVLMVLVLAMGLPLGGTTAVAVEGKEEVTRPVVGYDNGTFIRTDDEQFALTIRALVQPRYRYEQIQAVSDISAFEIRRARLNFAFALFQHVTGSAYLEHVTQESGTGPNLTYWWAEGTYQPIPEFGVTFGMITLPMDRQGEVEPDALAMIEPPITATQVDGVKAKSIARQSLSLPPTLGIRFAGDHKRVHYIVGIGKAGGDEHHFDPTSRQLAFSGRLAVDLLGEPNYDETDLAYSATPQLQVGIGSGYDGKDAVDDHINNVTLDWAWTGSADVSFKWRGLTVITEWYARRLKVKTGRFTLDDVGYYGQVGYFVVPKKLEVVARAAQIFRQGPDNNAYEIGGGLNWYLHGNHVKLQVDVNRLLDFDETEGQGHRAFNRFRAMLTIHL